MTQEITVIEDERDLGPAMEACTERQRLFIYHKLLNPRMSNTEAARQAGYSMSNPTVTAFNVAHNEKVLAAMKEEADKRLRAGAVFGAAVLVELAEASTSEAVRFKAAVELLNRAGLLVEHKQTVVVEHKTPEADKIAQVVEMSKRLGLDPRQLLGQAGVKYVDAEFEEVAEDDPWTIEPGGTG